MSEEIDSKPGEPLAPARRRWLFRGLYVVLMGLSVVAVLEGAARLLRSPTVAVVVRREVEEADPGGIVRATDDGRVFGGRPHYGDDTYSVDSRGLRGPDRPPLKEDGVQRLLLLGDSVAFGQGMAEDEYVAPLLEVELQKGGQWEVWNVSFPGWNTVQEAAALEVYAETVQPDRILVLWVANDSASLEKQIFSNESSGDVLYTDERFRPLDWPSVKHQVQAWRSSALVRLFFDLRGHGAAEEGNETSPATIGLADRDYRAAMQSLASQANELGVLLEVAMLPPLIDYPGWGEALGPGRPAASYVREPVWRMTVDLCRELSLRCLDLTPAIAPHKPSSLQINPGDSVHPSAQGHALLARWLGRHVLSTEGSQLAEP